MIKPFINDAWLDACSRLNSDHLTRQRFVFHPGRCPAEIFGSPARRFGHGPDLQVLGHLVRVLDPELGVLRRYQLKKIAACFRQVAMVGVIGDAGAIDEVLDEHGARDLVLRIFSEPKGNVGLLAIVLNPGMRDGALPTAVRHRS